MELLAYITITELRYILAVAQERHFGRAAQKCFVSQPTISIAIRKLEGSLGVVIFERSKTSLIITEVGQQILHKARQIIDCISDIQTIAKDSKSPFALPVKVGAIHTIGPYFFPKLINELNKKKSEIKLIIEEGYTQDLQTKLISGELDLIILASKFDYQGITTKPLYSEELEIIIPQNHTWKDRISIKPEELSTQTLLLLQMGNCFRDEILKICPTCAVKHNGNELNNNMITATSLETIKYMVASSLGISVMPKSAIKSDDNSLYRIKPFIKPTPHREVIIAYRDEFPRQAIIHQLIQSIQFIGSLL